MIVVTLFVLGAVLAFGYVKWLDGQGGIGGDFRVTTWDAGEAVLSGRSPYPVPDLVTLHFAPALYPAPYLVLLAPLSLVPLEPAMGAWMAALTVSILLALWAVGLRDARCYAITFVSLPVLAAIGLGNATALLMLSTALLWRWRDRPHRGAVSLACGLLIKPILWPLLIWLLVTRRAQLALEAAVIASLGALAGWAAIGFNGFAAYPGLMQAVSDAMAGNGLLVTSVLLDAGIPLWGAELMSFTLGASLLVGAIWVRGDLDRFTLSIVAALLITPVMWVHYFLLLYVPLAARYTRFSLAWLAPLALWPIAFGYETDGTRPAWTSLVGVAVLVAIMASVARQAPRSEPAGLTAGG